MNVLKRHKLFYLIISIIYVIFYDFIYRDYLVPTWGYMGAVYWPMSSYQYWLFIVLGSFPIVYHRGFNNISSALTIFVYIFIYVPLLETAFVYHEYDYGSVAMALVLFACMVFFFKTDNSTIGLKIYGIIRSRKKISFHTFESITYVFFIIVVIASGVRNFTFVNFLTDHTEMYELRDAYGQKVSAFAGYLICWFKYGFLPVLFVAYCKQRIIKKICIGYLLYFIMFLIDMQKMTFFMPFIIMLAFWGFSRTISSLHVRFFPYIIISIILLTLLLYLNVDNVVVSGLAAIFIMRTLCIEGWLFNIYLDFFRNHDYTYYTHINIVDLLFGGYPFGDMPLGNAVTEGGMNANACFMITDGYASLGSIGFVIAAICFVLFKSFFNNLSNCIDKVTLFCMSIPALAAMLNVSLFTAVFSYGYMWIFIIVCCVRFDCLLPQKTK